MEKKQGPTKNRAPTLPPRGRLVMEEVFARWRTSTHKTTGHIAFNGDDPKGEKARKVHGELCKLGYLTPSRKVFKNEVAFQLTVKGAGLVGEPEEAAKPLRGGRLLDRLAALLYCCYGENVGPVLRRRELVTIAPSVVPNKQSHPGLFYIDMDGEKGTLVRIECDHGAPVRRIVTRLADKVKRARRNPELKELMDAGCFRVDFLTCDEEKAREIIRATQQHGLLRHHQPKVSVIEELWHLLPNRQREVTSPEQNGRSPVAKRLGKLGKAIQQSRR